MKMKNTDIKLPEKHYVTFQQRENACPLGFMTPWGDDDAAKKRMVTADSWAASSYYGRKNKKPIEPKVLNNELLSGFRVMHSVDRSNRYNKNIVWRIEDPRGFELEISSGNMETIINECNIEKGEILEPCVWGRLKNANVLLPEASQEYQDAIENTKRVGTKVTIKDVPIGSIVLLHDGREAEYLGKFYTILSESNVRKGKSVQLSKTRKHCFYMDNDETSYYDGPSMFTVGTPKISKIIKPGSKTEADYEISINEQFSRNNIYVTSTEYGAIGIVSSKSQMDKLSLEKIDIDAVIDTWHVTRHSRPYVIVSRDEEWGMMEAGALYDYPPRSDRVKKIDLTANLLNTKHIQEMVEIVYDVTNVEASHGFSWGGTRYNTEYKTMDFTKNDVTWYRPYIQVNNPKTKNSLKIYL